MKKFVILSFWILSIVSCEPEDSSNIFGEIKGYVYLENIYTPAPGLQISLPGYGICQTDSEGYFRFQNVIKGQYKLNVFHLSDLLYSEEVEIEPNKITEIIIVLKFPKKDLPDFSVVDVSKECNWDYWVVGKEEYFYINEENSLPRSVFYHSFKTGKDYGIFFNEKGLPSKVITDNFIFLFDNFNGDKVDLGILSPSGEMQVIREIKIDFIWPSSPKSTQSKADVIRWTGRIVGAIPCVTIGATAFVTGGLAIPLALWTCGNYFLSMANNFFDDANIENGFTKFVEKYHLASTAYVCVVIPDPASCLLSLAFSGLDAYADYVEEMEQREGDISKLQLFILNTPLKEIIVQPGPEGKDAWISFTGFYNCERFYSSFGNDSLISVIHDVEGCSGQIDRMLLQFQLNQIPLDAVIFFARLELYGYATINQANSIPIISLYELKSSWSESGVTWNNQPEAELLSKLDLVSPGQYSWHSWDVSEIIQDWVDGRKGNFGFGIFAGKNYVWGEFYSGDHPYISRRPRLVVSYY